MKRLSVVLIVALLAGLFSGCRFAVVERDDSILAGAFTALAEEAEAEPVIGLHSRDEEGESRVRKLQKRLAELGYLGDEPDGVFGSMTLKALKRFQSDNGLDQTGVLDDATRTALYPQPSVTTAPDEVLYAKGANGDAVRRVQERLRQYGFATREADGAYDEETAEAVMAFQAYAVENYGTEFDDPLVEPELIENSALTVLANAAPEATPAPALTTAFPDMPALAPEATLRPAHAVDGVVSENLYNYLLADRFPTYRRTVQRGDAGVEVERVQRRLSTLEYRYDGVTGEFDDATAQNLKVFQRRSGLQQTGIADAETQALLFSAGAVAADAVEQPFYIKVSIDDQRVYIYRYLDGDYSYLIKTMVCSTGYGNTTPKGVFVSPGHRDSRWHYFVEFNCWAQYAFIIKGSILFHSVIFSGRDESTLRRSTLANLGHKASHGCVRLTVEDAKWIYDHCGAGQVVEIY